MRKVLTLVLALLLMLTLVSCRSKEVEEITEDDALSVVAASEIDHVEFSDGNKTLRFELVNGFWTWIDEPSFPLDDTVLKEILEEVPNLLALESVTSNDDLATFGLDEKNAYLTVSDENSTTDFIFGKENSIGQYYMRIDGQEGIYGVDKEFYEKLATSIFDMAILPVFPELRVDNVQSIQCSSPEDSTGEDGEILVIDATTRNTIIVNTSGVFKANGEDVTDKTTELLEEFSAMALESCADYSPSKGAAAICGLTEPAFNVKVIYKNSVDVRSTFSLAFGNLRASDNCYYVTVNDSSAIYTISADSVTTLYSIAKNGL